ncbi:hypothetical protein ACTXT7_015522 [Hymenolepis weldensis]
MRNLTPDPTLTPRFPSDVFLDQSLQLIVANSYSQFKNPLLDPYITPPVTSLSNATEFRFLKLTSFLPVVNQVLQSAISLLSVLLCGEDCKNLER